MQWKEMVKEQKITKEKTEALNEPIMVICHELKKMISQIQYI